MCLYLIKIAVGKAGLFASAMIASANEAAWRLVNTLMLTVPNGQTHFKNLAT